VSRSDELVRALVDAQVGGFLAQPPGLGGDPGLGVAGVTGMPRGRTWDATASAQAPDLVGDTITFVTLDDGTVVVDQNEPDDSLAPLADAIERTLTPPYRAAAVRSREDVWAAVAEKVTIVELAGVDGDVVELSVVNGQQELEIDGKRAEQPPSGLEKLAAEHGDVSLHAERVDRDIFAVDVFPL